MDQSVSKELAGEQVFVMCRNLASGSTSFADQLVKELLVERKADDLILVGAPQRFASYVLESADRRGVRSRVNVQASAQLSV